MNHSFVSYLGALRDFGHSQLVDAAKKRGHVRTMARIHLDLSGLKCPLPVLKARKVLRGLAAGEELEVIATDPMSAIDIPNMVREEGDELVTQGKAQRHLTFVIAKR
jgi:tRNA 2-thiouridine synthesizing protein A